MKKPANVRMYKRIIDGDLDMTFHDIYDPDDKQW